MTTSTRRSPRAVRQIRPLTWLPGTTVALWLMLACPATNAGPSAFADCTGGPETYVCLTEAGYLAAVASLSDVAFVEGFEDDAVWGGARTTGTITNPVIDTLPSVTSNGTVWTTNHPLVNGISTSSGAARTGGWGVYDPKHGAATGTPAACDIDNPPEHCLYHDGVTGTRLATESALVGAGGFFSGMVGANIAVALDDGVPIGLRKLTGAGHEFVGVISTLGFRKFQFVELDGKIGQALAIFADDFAFGAVRNECPSALACSYFNIDAEDWAVIDWPDIQVGPAAWTGSTGNPGGSIFPNDPDTGDRYFSAPAKFLGDKSAAYGGTLTYDMLVTDSDTPPWDQPFISITGGNMTLNWTAAAWPVVNAWNTYEVRLDETGGWTRSSDNSTPTASEFASVLSSLSALIVRGEFRSGTNRGYLDNVVLASDISILTVTKAGAGRGTVTSDPAGISCGSTCLAPFSSNATVTLTATADSGSTFAGWSPSPCAATFAMPTTDLTCTATFEFCWACLPSRGGWRSAIR